MGLCVHSFQLLSSHEPDEPEKLRIQEQEKLERAKIEEQEKASWEQQRAWQEQERRRAGYDRFIPYDNGTVLDTKTNLMWAARDNGKTIDWNEAKAYCEQYRGGDYPDWRMPTERELMGLYDGSFQREPGEYHLTSRITLTDSRIWAVEYRSDVFDPRAACINFDNGTLSWDSTIDSKRRALPVRRAGRILESAKGESELLPIPENRKLPAPETKAEDNKAAELLKSVFGILGQ